MSDTAPASAIAAVAPLITVGQPGRAGASAKRSRAIAHLPPLWRNRPFLMIFTGQVVSLTGFGANELALTLLVLGLTHALRRLGW